MSGEYTRGTKKHKIILYVIIQDRKQKLQWIKVLTPVQILTFFLDQLSDLPKNINLLQVLGSSVHHTHTKWAQQAYRQRPFQLNGDTKFKTPSCCRENAAVLNEVG